MHNSLLHLILKIGDFLNTDISQGSVATRLGFGGVFVYGFVTNFLLSLTVKEFSKIGQYLVKLWARVRCLVFLTHSVDSRSASAALWDVTKRFRLINASDYRPL